MCGDFGQGSESHASSEMPLWKRMEFEASLPGDIKRVLELLKGLDLKL